MGKVLKDRKTILRTFMSNLKAKKQADDSKGSYQKAQERVIARKTALARKRARETAAKHQAALKAVIEDDKLLPNQEGTGTSGCYSISRSIDPILQLGQNIRNYQEQAVLDSLDGTAPTITPPIQFPQRTPGTTE